MSSPSPTIVSAPGKVLVAGGYLVLDPAYRGVVVSTSSRFYSVVQDAAGGAAANRIVVRSPQFTDAAWQYDVGFEGGLVSVEPSSGSASKNKFVHLALLHTLKLIAEIRESKGAATEPLAAALTSGIDIAIVGDNDFYSQREKLSSLGLQPTLSDLSSLPPFSPIGVPLASVHKTGLGSSAALITSLVSALLLHLRAIDAERFADGASADRRLAHHAAQFVHCLAQGKVGSGFDVAAAIFGSHMYKRFGEGVIRPLLGMEGAQKLYPVLSPTNTAWDYVAESFTLPPFVRLILGDVSIGSETPSMVKDVLRWRSASGTAEAANVLWNEINESNQGLANALQKLTYLASQIRDEYEATVTELSSLPPSEVWSPKHGVTPLQTPDGSRTVAAGLYEVHQISENIRKLMRTMGQAAKVDIEPPEQTRLLDTCMSIDGVVGGGVPGAGGYDAIWLLVLDPPAAADPPVARVERAWSEYERANAGVSVSPLLARESEEQGARVEALGGVPGLRDAVAAR
ncbi:Phosphomevalonate kinase [Coniophora puteana RWD-64-598 SS2]|uniref:Phosphomevalonate kinase n=1 Tax=Coniophora puteana (strain RWD-64-598) TaxID=741705 RepID=A0A5M3MWS7_CONPW|nr:Phosphomevalonate kinase [Coniophora puteana RWD-64-598 SS2]EIW83214.1 Phosphomevalonate kinase [Coniophora puteana RWD-64-598 SS2]